MQTAVRLRLRRIPTATAILVAMTALAVPAYADTLEILVREREGRPIADQALSVHPTSTLGTPLFLLGPDQVRRVRTGADGRVIVEGLKPANYTITVGRIDDPNLIHPSANPYAPAPTFTVGSGQERIAIAIELWRGVPLMSDVQVDRGDIPRCRLVLRSLDGAASVNVPFSDTGRADHLLVPGRWEASLEFPPGYLLVDVMQNGAPFPGSTVRFDVLDDNRPQSLQWTLSARALVTGRVTTIGDSRCLGRVVATLIEPGPWYPEIVARGGSEFRRVPAQFITSPCDYMLWLPDGAWRLEAVGEQVSESIPASVDVSLAPGESRNLNFEVRAGDGKSARLMVQVEAPDAKSPFATLAGAVVEVWPAERAADSKPLRTARTGQRSSTVEFTGLPAGDYLIVAGHADYLENSEPLPKYSPDPERPKNVTIILKQAAKIAGHALDENGKPVADVALDIARVGEPAPTLLDDKELAARKTSVSARTDLTGWATATGLPPGTYRASAHISGELEGTRFVSVRRGDGKPAIELEVQLEEAATVELDLPVRPAASFSGRLACTDGKGFPAKASFRVFSDANDRPDAWKDAELVKDAALALDDVRPKGQHIDQFRVGPLVPGEYVIAVRPVGYEYWTWIHNVLVSDTASVLHANETSNTDMGATPLECSPLVTIVPRLLSAETLPDFRDVEIEVELTTDSKRPASRGGANTSEGADESVAFAGGIERHESRAFVRGLPEGKTKLSIALHHPYLIPDSLKLPAQSVDLLRGKLVTLNPSFQRVGGLVAVHVKGAAARLVPLEGQPAVHLAAVSNVAFPGTLPGTYRVDACVDAACTQVSHSWERVAVEAAKTVTLSEP